MEPCDWLSKIPDTDVSVCVIIPESRKNSVKENLSHLSPPQTKQQIQAYIQICFS